MGEVKYVAVYAVETFICLMALGGEAKKVFLASCSISQYTYSPHQPINISAFWTLNCDVMDGIYTEQFCSYSIICNKFTCKDDVMLFFCYWRCIKKKDSCTTYSGKNPHERAVILFATSKPLLMFQDCSYLQSASTAEKWCRGEAKTFSAALASFAMTAHPSPCLPSGVKHSYRRSNKGNSSSHSQKVGELPASSWLKPPSKSLPDLIPSIKVEILRWFCCVVRKGSEVQMELHLGV